MSKVDTPVESETPVSANEQIHAEFMEVVQTLSTFKTTITMLSNQIKSLERNVKKNKFFIFNLIILKNFFPSKTLII